MRRFVRRMACAAPPDVKSTLKSLAARLPGRAQQSLKRRYFASQIRRHRFRTNEPEYDLAETLLSEGDWALDVGANIGQYTLHFSRLVGASGRVIAFEPVPATFELLAANVSYSGARNATLINAAASDSARVLGMDIPKFETGPDNFYRSHLSPAGHDISVLCLPIDALDLPHRVRLVKIDAEGHDLHVLEGMRELLRRDRPILFIEDNSEREKIRALLAGLGYSMRRLPGSANTIFEAG